MGYLVNRYPAGSDRAQACLDVINLVGRAYWHAMGFEIKQDAEGKYYAEGKLGDGTPDPQSRLYSFAEVEPIEVDGVQYEQFYSPSNLEMFANWKTRLTTDMNFADFGEEILYEPPESEAE